MHDNQFAPLFVLPLAWAGAHQDRIRCRVIESYKRREFELRAPIITNENLLVFRTTIPIVASSNFSHIFTSLVNSVVGYDISSRRGPTAPAIHTSSASSKLEIGRHYVVWVQLLIQRKMS